MSFTREAVWDMVFTLSSIETQVGKISFNSCLCILHDSPSMYNEVQLCEATLVGIVL